MLEHLEQRRKRLEELQLLISSPDIIANRPLYQKYARELSSLMPIVSKYKAYLALCAEMLELSDIAERKNQDPEFLDLVRQELDGAARKKEEIIAALERLLVSEEDSDLADRPVIMEIRAGTGGVEASLFARDLFRMYSKYASGAGWKLETLSSSTTEKGGFKEVVFSINGPDAYGRLKNESGTHRVQRVPATEASGRIHTSAVTVAVMPEPREVEVNISPGDLRIDVFRAGGRGGQHVNVTDSAVRITHLPTGVVVSCQDERSQHKNKAKGMRVLRARLLDRYELEERDQRSKKRKVQVGSGDRSEKIRTYNYPDSRVTDHRIGLTLHKLGLILEGNLDEIFSALREAEFKIRLEAKLK